MLKKVVWRAQVYRCCPSILTKEVGMGMGKRQIKERMKGFIDWSMVKHHIDEIEKSIGKMERHCYDYTYNIQRELDCLKAIFREAEEKAMEDD